MEQRNQECFLVTEKQNFIHRILSYEDSFTCLNSEKASQLYKVHHEFKSKYVLCVCVCVWEREREREREWVWVVYMNP